MMGLGQGEVRLKIWPCLVSMLDFGGVILLFYQIPLDIQTLRNICQLEQ